MWTNLNAKKAEPTGESEQGLSPNGHTLNAADAPVGTNSSPVGAGPFRWSPDAIHRLDDEVQWALTSNPSGPAEIAGILLGKGGSPVEIADCHPVFLMQERDHTYALTGPGSREFERTIASFRLIPKNGLSVVGFYRSRIGEDSNLTDEDLGLIRTCFRDACQVALLINTTRERLRCVRLFSGDYVQPLSELHFAEDEAQLPRWLELWHHLSGETEKEAARPIEVNEIQKRDASEIAPVIIAEEEPEEPFPVKPRSNRGLSFVLAAAVIIALLVGILMFKGSARLKQGSDTPGAAAVQGSDLALQAHKDGDDLRLEWNHAAPILAGASGGILTIREGKGQEKNVTLDGDLLRTGSVVYRPVHRDVSLRLVIFGQGGAKLGESVATYPQQVSNGQQ